MVGQTDTGSSGHLRGYLRKSSDVFDESYYPDKWVEHGKTRWSWLAESDSENSDDGDGSGERTRSQRVGGEE